MAVRNEGERQIVKLEGSCRAGIVQSMCYVGATGHLLIGGMSTDRRLRRTGKPILPTDLHLEPYRRGDPEPDRRLGSRADGTIVS